MKTDLLAAALNEVDEAQEVAESVTGAWTTLVEALPRIGIALGVLVALEVIGRVVRRVVRWRLSKNRTPSFARVFSQLSSAAITLAGALAAVTIVFPSVQPVDVLAGAGLLTVAVGFAFQDILSNLLSGILLLFRQPFVGGDQIEVIDHIGTVQEINIRETVLKTFDGRKVLIPNKEVYTNAIKVQTGFALVRTSIVVGIAYEADMSEARRVALDAVCGVAGVADDPPPEALFLELAESTVKLEVWFWSAPNQIELRRIQDQVIELVKVAMDGAGIELLPAAIVALQATSSFQAALAGRPVTPGGARAEGSQ
jgi:small-conductance mechanosensitive channel